MSKATAWTEEKIEKIIELWPTTQAKVIAERIGVSDAAIYSTVKVIRSFDAGLCKQRPRGGIVRLLVSNVISKRKLK